MLADQEVVVAKGDKPFAKLVAVPQGGFKVGLLVQKDLRHTGENFVLVNSALARFLSVV